MMNRVQTHDFWESPTVRQFELGGGSRNFIYVVRAPGGESLILDTQVGMKAVWEAIEGRGGKVEGVVLTHTHWDHVPGLPELSERYPGLPLYVHPQELHRIEKEPYLKKFRRMEIGEGAVLRVGSLELRVLHTPGHSAGGCCFYLPDPEPVCFTGDTLFLGDCGRTDLPTGSDEEMFRSLAKLKLLPPETRVLPGHHYRPETSSLLKDELEANPALRCQSVAELKALA